MSEPLHLCHYFLALLTPLTKVSFGSQLLMIALNTKALSPLTADRSRVKLMAQTIARIVITGEQRLSISPRDHHRPLS